MSLESKHDQDEPPQAPLDLYDRARLAHVREVLSSLLIHDIVPTVIEYARQSKLLLLTGEYVDGKYLPSSKLWICNPAADEWTAYELNEPMHWQSRRRFMGATHGERLTIGDDCPAGDGSFMIRTLDLYSGRVRTDRYDADELDRTIRPVDGDTDDLRGFIHLQSASSGMDYWLSYHVEQGKWMKIISEAVTADMAPCMFSVMDGRLFMHAYMDSNVYEIISDNRKRTLAPPPFQCLRSLCHVVHRDMIYVCGIAGEECHQYDLIKNVWSHMPSLPAVRSSQRFRQAAIIDDTIYVFARDLQDKPNVFYSYDLIQANGTWQTLTLPSALQHSVLGAALYGTVIPGW